MDEEISKIKMMLIACATTLPCGCV